MMIKKGIKKYGKDKWICDDCGLIFTTIDECKNHEQFVEESYKKFSEMFDRMMETDSNNSDLFDDFIDDYKKIALK